MARKVTPGMWVRRIVSTLILIALLVLVIFVGSKLVGFGHSKLSERQQEMQAAEQNLPVTIRDCGSSDLQVTVTPQVTAATVGEGFVTNVRVAGKTAEACRFSTSDLDLTLQMGKQTVWSPTKCSKSWDTVLLLGADSSCEKTLKWKGNLYSECKAQKNADGQNLVADPGKYFFEGTLLGVQIDKSPTVDVDY